MQSELGDYNTLLGKLQQGTSLEDIENEIVALETQNANRTTMIDDVFLGRKKEEDVIKGIEADIIKEQEKVLRLVEGLDETKKKQFEVLRKENEEYLMKIEACQTVLEVHEKE